MVDLGEKMGNFLGYGLDMGPVLWAKALNEEFIWDLS